MSRIRVLAMASVTAGVLLGVFGGAAASAKCVRRYRDLAQPIFDRRITVHHYHHLSCTAASRVGSAVADAYERGLPLADYPPPPSGVPGGQGRTFKVHSRAVRDVHVPDDRTRQRLRHRSVPPRHAVHELRVR